MAKIKFATREGKNIIKKFCRENNCKIKQLELLLKGLEINLPTELREVKINVHELSFKIYNNEKVIIDLDGTSMIYLEKEGQIYSFLAYDWKNGGENIELLF